MSFTSEVKQEICQNDLDDCCKRAELSAFLQISASLNMDSGGMYIKATSESASTAKRVYQLVKDLYQVETELSIIKKMNLKKNNIYVVKIRQKPLDILRDLDIYDDNGLREYPSESIQKDCCIRSYVAGAFLAKGSVNSPKKSNYHLEISCNSKGLSDFILSKLNDDYHLNAKSIMRRNMHIIYIKASDHISDFLKLIGASSTLFQFEDTRIQRDFLNNLTRLDNCELANEMKSIKAGAKQLEDIERIENFVGLETLNSNLYEVAIIRKENPEASLNELCDIYEEHYGKSISKSGIRHRLNKIKETAERFKPSKCQGDL